MKDYHINIFRSDKDGGYIADLPDLVVCSAFGSISQEALAQLVIAKEAWLKSAPPEGKPVPAPTYRPVIYQAAG